MHKLTVPRRSTEELEIQVNQPGLLVEWEFQIHNKDIEFGIDFKDDAKKRYSIKPVKKIDEEEFTESGTLQAETAGTCK